MYDFHLILSSSTIDKIFEIFGPIFEQNANINFEPIFEKSVNFGPIFEKNANFGRIFEKSANFERVILSMVNKLIFSRTQEFFGRVFVKNLGSLKK